MADAVARLLRPGLSVSVVGEELLVLDAESAQVFRVPIAGLGTEQSGVVGDAGSASTADDAMERLVAALDAHGLIEPRTRDDLWSRRRVLAGSAALGAVGVGVLALPTAAAAASSESVSTTSTTTTTVAGASVLGADWVAVQTLPEANDWYSVAYGDGVWVAVADGDDTIPVMRSTDGGVTWSLAESVPAASLSSVAFGNGVWVAIGEDQTDDVDTPVVIRSTDGGLNWQLATGVPQNTWSSVAYGVDAGVWVAVATGNDTIPVMRSTDGGASWSLATPSEGFAPTGDMWFSVAYGGGQFVAVGTGSVELMRSADGNDWTSYASPADYIWLSVAYGNGVWVAVSQHYSPVADPVLRSTDGGSTWQTVNAPSAPWQSVAYGDGVWIAVGNDLSDRMIRSTDGGATWTAVDSLAIQDKWLQAVAYGGDRFVVVENATTSAFYSTSSV